jgi:CPA2 family monovalent cation:H+ antiporter-2
VEAERDLMAGMPQDALFKDGRVQLEGPVAWPDGTRLTVTPVLPPGNAWNDADGHFIIVGFGLAGRCVADLLDRLGLSYTIVEQNPVTVETQRALGRNIIEGDAAHADTLVEAGINTASSLALTIPDEDAVLTTIQLVRRLRPDIKIIARTNYSSKGMQAVQLGADEVIKAEQAVALQFYDKLSRRLCRKVVPL